MATLNVIGVGGFPQTNGVEYMQVPYRELPPVEMVGMMEGVRMDMPSAPATVEGFTRRGLARSIAAGEVSLEGEEPSPLWPWATFFLLGSLATVGVATALGYTFIKGR